MISWVKKYENKCKYLNYVKHLLVLASTLRGCVSSSELGLKICTMIVGIKKYKPIIKKKKKKLDKTVLLGKIKLNTTEVVSL